MRACYCGKEDCLSEHFFGPAVRTHYLIHFILKGKGIYKTECGYFELERGKAFLIRPGEISYYRADVENPWSYAWVAFEGEDAQKLLERYYPNLKYPVCDIENMSAALAAFDALLEIFGKMHTQRENILGYFYLIMGSLAMTAKGIEIPEKESYYKKAVSFIQRNYSYPIQIQEVADYVGIDRTYLYRIFVSQTGQSPKEYLSQYRLFKAKEMLCDTNYRITEIAYSCGYHDSSSFCKHFQKEEKMSPLEYRGTRNSRPLLDDWKMTEK